MVVCDQAWVAGYEEDGCCCWVGVAIAIAGGGVDEGIGGYEGHFLLSPFFPGDWCIDCWVGMEKWF